MRVNTIFLIVIIIAVGVIGFNKKLRNIVVSAVRPYYIEHFGTQDEKLGLDIEKFYRIVEQEDVEKLKEAIAEEEQENILAYFESLFADYDLKYNVVSRKSAKITRGKAVMNFELEILRVNGRPYRNRREKGVLTMKRGKDKWLFESFKVYTLSYLL